MDTIDYSTMRTVADVVNTTIIDQPGMLIHTVTVTLNGQHGGADLTIEGTDHKDQDVTLVSVIR